jgi:hypothetical protein
MFLPLLLAGALGCESRREQNATRGLADRSLEDRASFSRWLESTALIFLGRHAGRAMKRSRKAGLRGELRIERYLREP